MGAVHYICKTNDFWIKNLPAFREGLKGYVGGEWDSLVRYNYSDYKRRSQKALLNLNSEDFTVEVCHKSDPEDTLNLMEYIKEHIVEGETCTAFLVAYEHAQDMSITKYVVTSETINEQVILED